MSAAVLMPALAAVLALALPRRRVGVRVTLATVAPAASFALLLSCAGDGGGVTPAAVSWMPDFRLDWAFLPDRLGLFYGLLVSAMGVLVALYARAYFGRNHDQLYRFYPTLLLFMTAMLGLVLADNFVLMLLFWELTSVSSYLLMGWERDDPAAVQKAMQAFVITGIGGLVLMTGLVLLGLHTGNWSFSSLLSNPVPLDGRTAAAFVLIFAGAAAKSAQWPLHFWLPGAMAAPTPVSAYLHSATMVKAGIYLVGRLWPVLGSLALWPTLIISIGALTMVLGAYVALRKSDLKQIFAYTTVSQLGLLMTAYGLGGLRYHGEPNLLWDVTQVLNHALYKAPLFLLAGAIGHEIHTRELPQMRGLVRRGGRQTIMAMLLIAAAYALAAGPLTLSFTAKELFFYQVYHAVEVVQHPLVYLLPAASIATGLFNVALFVRLARVLLGRPDVRAHAASAPPSVDEPAQYVAHADDRPDRTGAYVDEDVDVDVPDGRLWMSMLWLPAAVLVAFQYVAGVVPAAHGWILGPLERPESLNYPFHTLATLPTTWHAILHPGVPAYMSLVTVVLGVMLGFAPVFTRVLEDAHERLFPAFYKLVVNGGGRAFRMFQTGYLRTYVMLFFLAVIALFVRSVWGIAGYVDSREAAELVDPALLPGYLLTLLMCLAAVLMPVVEDRASRIMVLGVAGTGATALFYVYQAPDLALTQISIEVVSLILFLLVLSLLPVTAVRRRTLVAPRLALAIGVGAVTGLLTFAATTGDRPLRVLGTAEGQPLSRLGDYFLRNSYVGRDTLGLRPADVHGGVFDRGPTHPESFRTHPWDSIEHAPAAEPGRPAGRVNLHKGGGGANVVNVILVDFRGFDTFGEITVLALAALGVWTLLRRHADEDEDLPPAAEHSLVSPAPPGTRMSTTILLQAGRLLVPLALIVSAFIFFKGHQVPGGGFVGGLVAATALILYRMCAGGDALRRLLPVWERTLIAAGLLLALATGGAALLAGLPFLTSTHGYLPLSGERLFHWATVLFFDAGVFLVVVGVTVGLIDALSRELELRRQAVE